MHACMDGWMDACMHTYIHVYIYIQREREREKDIERERGHTYMYNSCIYMYIYRERDIHQRCVKNHVMPWLSRAARLVATYGRFP